MQVISTNTQAILLLTAPLIIGKVSSTADLLRPAEYKRLTRYLRELQLQPADLITSESTKILQECHPIIDKARLQRLLERGFLLSQAIERWQARAIWVISRADAGYPRRLKAKLREDSPALLYGSGDISLLEMGGLAVVGSRKVSEDLINYTKSIGQLAAYAGRTIISGGARGVDQAAMKGASESGGKVIGVLAENLEKVAMNREERNQLLQGNLTLVSAYDPNAGFSIGHAMERNKLIYALADSSLVVNSDKNKGGTWAGAIEQLEKFNFVPVFIRSTGEYSSGLEGLQKKGALPWPNPQDVDSFDEVFNVVAPAHTITSQIELSPFQNEISLYPKDNSMMLTECSSPTHTSLSKANQRILSNKIISDVLPRTPEVADLEPSEVLFSTVCTIIQQLLKTPMKDNEVAAALGVSNAQTKIWLNRMVEENRLEKLLKPVRFVIKAPSLFK